MLVSHLLPLTIYELWIESLECSHKTILKFAAILIFYFIWFLIHFKWKFKTQLCWAFSTDQTKYIRVLYCFLLFAILNLLKINYSDWVRITQCFAIVRLISVICSEHFFFHIRFYLKIILLAFDVLLHTLNCNMQIEKFHTFYAVIFSLNTDLDSSTLEQLFLPIHCS